MAGTEESWSEFIGNLRVEESSTSGFSLHRTEEKERKGARKRLATLEAGSENGICWVEEAWASRLDFWALG